MQSRRSPHQSPNPSEHVGLYIQKLKQTNVVDTPTSFHEVTSDARSQMRLWSTRGEPIPTPAISCGFLTPASNINQLLNEVVDCFRLSQKNI
jgi:hypothetical protein